MTLFDRIKNWFQYSPIDRLIEFNKQPSWRGCVVPFIASIAGALLGCWFYWLVLT